jgi:hypothetical protein
MRTVVLGPRPPELDALIARRRALGLDTHDEVWKGEYHMAPTAHSSHGWLDDQLAVLLHPLAQAAGLGVTGPFNLVSPTTSRSLTAVCTGPVLVRCGSRLPPLWSRSNRPTTRRGTSSASRPAMEWMSC